MLSLIVKRVLQLVPTVFFVSVIIFSLQHLLPGDPALIMAGEDKDPQVIAQIRAQYHLDQPIPIQYFFWIKGVLQGDLGKSMRLKTPVLELVATKLPVTLQLACMAMLIALSLGVSFGVLCAVYKGRLLDGVVNVVGLMRSPRLISGWASCWSFYFRCIWAGCQLPAMSARSRISASRLKPPSCRPLF